MATAPFVLDSGKNWFDCSEVSPGFFNLVRESREKRPTPMAVDSQVLSGQFFVFSRCIENCAVSRLNPLEWNRAGEKKGARKRPFLTEELSLQSAGYDRHDHGQHNA